ncbi:HNH endonuclease [Clavibacter capsici]|uniref:HNH endonuclease n=1 Tax=Clavibacter capsici TaxID=1874630 RepID=UPI00142871E0|nr:HNH endonuclease signature motif containing protein [Clavibacter capsici]QIS38624.1 HNH endonuclease [Clavibacter capsici]
MSTVTSTPIYDAMVCEVRPAGPSWLPTPLHAGASGRLIPRDGAWGSVLYVSKIELLPKRMFAATVAGAKARVRMDQQDWRFEEFRAAEWVVPDPAAHLTPTMTDACVRPGRSKHSVPKRIRERVFAEKGDRCVVCGVRAGEVRYPSTKPVVMTVDHVLPVAAGGCGHFHNLQPMCLTHNQEKADRVEWEVAS